METKMAPDANFERISCNPFTVNDNFFNFESDPDINFYSDISPLDTKYFKPNEIREGFECLCKNGFSVLISFSETWATDNSIYNDSNFQIQNYTVLHQVRKSGRGEGLSILLYKGGGTIQLQCASFCAPFHNVNKQPQP